MLKAVIENNGKRAYIDFCTSKGFDVIYHALKRINYQENDYCHAKAGEVNLRFTKTTDEFNRLKELVQPSTFLTDILSACHTLSKDDKDLLSYIDEKFKNNKIKTVSDVDFFGKLHYANELLKEHPIVIPDPNTIIYEQIRIFNKKALFTPNRIDRSKLPKGVYVYETMCDDGSYGEITMLAKTVHVNFWGTILTTNKIALTNGYRNVDEEKDIDFLNKPCIVLKEFLINNQPNKKKEILR